jgi:hypothetical protein
MQKPGGAPELGLQQARFLMRRSRQLTRPQPERAR